MSTVQRYELDKGHGYMAYPTMEEDDHGDYVLYSDYEALRAQVAGLSKCVEAAKGMCDAPIVFCTCRGPMPTCESCEYAMARKRFMEALAEAAG